jgi:ribonuclease VapC
VITDWYRGTVVSVLLREVGHEAVLDSLEAAPAAGIGAPTLVETGIVLVARLGIIGKTLLARLCDEAGLTVVPFGPEHWPLAVDAYIRYGRGRHPAALSFGDCLTYAVCRLADQPLLCIGDDFARTDLDLVR